MNMRGCGGVQVKFADAIVQFSFKFDGATMASLSMNAEKGHVCRVRFTPTGFTVIKDKDKDANLSRAKRVTSIPARWTLCRVNGIPWSSRCTARTCWPALTTRT